VIIVSDSKADIAAVRDLVENLSREGAALAASVSTLTSGAKRLLRTPSSGAVGVRHIPEEAQP
jgi:hypothetical protein